MQTIHTSRNHYYDHSNLSTYFKQYLTTLHSSLYQIDLSRAHHAILNRRGRIFVGGNGGSASISDHLTCDFEKGASLQTHSLVGRTALVTAIANDIGYDQIFAYQLKSAKLKAEELVILISSSGNSPNILAAAEYAKSVNATVLGLTGFSGGSLRRIADVNLHVDVKNYGVVEDAHQAIMHVLAQYIYLTAP